MKAPKKSKQFNKETVRRLNGVGKHNNCGFFCRRPGSFIPEFPDINRIAVRHLQGFMIEIDDGSVSMALQNDILNFLGQMLLLV